MPRKLDHFFFNTIFTPWILPPPQVPGDKSKLFPYSSLTRDCDRANLFWFSSSLCPCFLQMLVRLPRTCQNSSGSTSTRKPIKSLELSNRPSAQLSLNSTSTGKQVCRLISIFFVFVHSLCLRPVTLQFTAMIGSFTKLVTGRRKNRGRMQMSRHVYDWQQYMLNISHTSVPVRQEAEPALKQGHSPARASGRAVVINIIIMNNTTFPAVMWKWLPRLYFYSIFKHAHQSAWRQGLVKNRKFIWKAFFKCPGWSDSGFSKTWNRAKREWHSVKSVRMPRPNSPTHDCLYYKYKSKGSGLIT